MDDLRLTFHVEADDPENYPDGDQSWYAQDPYSDERVGLCDSGLRAYVGLPEECEEFDAVFSAYLPSGNVAYFEIAPNDSGTITLKTQNSIGWYEFVPEMLAALHRNDYRFLSVEYDNG